MNRATMTVPTNATPEVATTTKGCCCAIPTGMDQCRSSTTDKSRALQIATQLVDGGGDSMSPLPDGNNRSSHRGGAETSTNARVDEVLGAPYRAWRGAERLKAKPNHSCCSADPAGVSSASSKVMTCWTRRS